MKTVGTWSVDADVKAWIDRKIANKSQFVNRILRDAMLDEIISQARKEQRPRCPDCSSPMRVNEDGGRFCTHIVCGTVIE